MVKEPSNEWTLGTLKELVEIRLDATDERIKANRVLQESAAAHVAEALKGQAAEYERRLDALNHEAARIAAANASNVSREVYDSFIIALDDWKRRMEITLANAVPQTEYRAYKESTSAALTLQAGNREGVKLTGSTIFAVVMALSGLIGIFVGVQSYISKGATPPPPQIIYVQPAQSPTTTTITKP